MADVYKPTSVDPLTGERLKNKYWYFQYRDADGRLRNVKGLRGRAATLLMAAELERHVARVKAGIAEPSDPQRRRPLREHLEDFRRTLPARCGATTIKRLRAVLDGCGFFGPTEIDAFRVRKWLRERRRAGHFTDAESVGHLKAIRAFTAWLLQERRTSVDPLARTTRRRTKPPTS